MICRGLIAIAAFAGIARPDLLAWMGYDAIRHFTDSICSMKESLTTISDQIAALKQREALKSIPGTRDLPTNSDHTRS